MTWCTQAPSDGVEVSTFESQPALPRADTSCSAEERRAEEAQCVFESNHTARVADVSSTTVEEGTSGEPSVFKSTLAPRFAAMRCSEEVVAENAGNCTFESCPAKSSEAVTWETQVTETSDDQSVFENQPLVSRVNARWPRKGEPHEHQPFDAAVPLRRASVNRKVQGLPSKVQHAERLDQTSHRYAFQPSVWISVTEPDPALHSRRTSHRDHSP